MPCGTKVLIFIGSGVRIFDIWGKRLIDLILVRLIDLVLVRGKTEVGYEGIISGVRGYYIRGKRVLYPG